MFTILFIFNSSSYQLKLIVKSDIKLQLNIMEVFSVISGTCYMAFATVCLMMAIVIAFNESIALKISITVWVFYEKLAKVLWTSFLALIDQDNFMVTRWPSKIGWWMMCVSIFVAMQGYILNLVSTDIAVPS